MLVVVGYIKYQYFLEIYEQMADIYMNIDH